MPPTTGSIKQSNTHHHHQDHLKDLQFLGRGAPDSRMHYQECQQRVLLLADRFHEGTPQNTRLMQVTSRVCFATVALLFWQKESTSDPSTQQQSAGVRSSFIREIGEHCSVALQSTVPSSMPRPQALERGQRMGWGGGPQQAGRGRGTRVTGRG